MKWIKLIILVMIAQCCYLESYCKENNNDTVPSLTGSLNNDSVYIAISEIRKANLYIIKAKIQDKIIEGKDSLIYLQNKKIEVYKDSYNKMKETALATERINKNLEESLKRSNRQKIIYGGVAGSLATSLLLFILIK